MHCAAKKIDHRQLSTGRVWITGKALRVRETSRPYQPVAAPLVCHAEVVGRDKRLMPIAYRRLGIGCRSVEFAVALSKQRKGVLV